MRINTTAWNRVRYSIYAPFYDLVGRLLDSGRRRSIELVDPNPGDDILIVGCGTGLDFPHLPHDVNITAVDLSPAMITRARRRSTSLGIDVDCRVMNAHNLDLPAGSYDVVLLHLILAVVPDPEAAMSETYRVLRPSGRVGIFDKFLSEDAEASLLRRIANVATNVIATDITRKLEPLARRSGIRILHQEPILPGNVFRIACGEKPSE